MLLFQPHFIVPWTVTKARRADYLWETLLKMYSTYDCFLSETKFNMLACFWKIQHLHYPGIFHADLKLQKWFPSFLNFTGTASQTILLTKRLRDTFILPWYRFTPCNQTFSIFFLPYYLHVTSYYQVSCGTCEAHSFCANYNEVIKFVLCLKQQFLLNISAKSNCPGWIIGAKTARKGQLLLWMARISSKILSTSIFISQRFQCPFPHGKLVTKYYLNSPSFVINSCKLITMYFREDFTDMED